MKALILATISTLIEMLVKYMIEQEGKTEEEARKKALSEVAKLDSSAFDLYMLHKAKKEN